MHYLTTTKYVHSPKNSVLALGTFTNYVSLFLSFFDHLTRNVDKKSTLLVNVVCEGPLSLINKLRQNHS